MQASRISQTFWHGNCQEHAADLPRCARQEDGSLLAAGPTGAHLFGDSNPAPHYHKEQYPGLVLEPGLVLFRVH